MVPRVFRNRAAGPEVPPENAPIRRFSDSPRRPDLAAEHPGSRVPTSRNVACAWRKRAWSSATGLMVMRGAGQSSSSSSIALSKAPTSEATAFFGSHPFHSIALKTIAIATPIRIAIGITIGGTNHVLIACHVLIGWSPLFRCRRCIPRRTRSKGSQSTPPAPAHRPSPAPPRVPEG